MRFLLCILLLSVINLSCRKDKAHTTGSGVEIYLLQSYQLVPGKCQVDAATAVLEKQPVVCNDDILEYSRSRFIYKLTDIAFSKVESLNWRIPFAVTVDKKVIFYGIRMSYLMSSTCDHSITMFETFGTEKGIYLDLGYPGSLVTGSIEDKRNDELIIKALAQQGKLKD